MVWRDLSDEVLESVYKPKSIDYFFRCPRCGQEVCRCGVLKISDVKAGMDHIVVTGTIVDANQPVVIETKYGRTLLSRSILEDPSGRLRLNLWGEHATKSSGGNTVRVENAFASRYHSGVQLNLGWRGTILLLNSPTSPSTLEHDLSYIFQQKNLLLQALTRNSYAHERRQQHPDVKVSSNEGLAFLGDAAIDLVVSEYLYSTKPAAAKGEQTASWQGIASHPQCASAGMRLGLYKYLRIPEGETPLAQSDTIMEETYEAVIGAVFLDGLYEKASLVVKKTLIEPLLRK